MNYTWIKSQEESTNNSFLPFELKENYTSTTTKYSKSKLGVKDKLDNQTKGVLFLAKTIKEEVLQGTKKEQKKNIKQLKKLFLQLAMISMTVGLGTSLEMITTQPITASANSILPTAQSPQITDLDPSEVMKWGLIIAVIVVAVGVALAMVLFAVAGIYLMFTRKRDEASSWTSDIIRGLTQVIVAIPLVYAIFQLAQAIFSNIPFLNGLM